MRLRPPDVQCREAVELVTGYLEGSLTRRTRRTFEKHLRACDGCDAYLAQMRVIIDTTGGVGPEDLDAATLDGITELYRQFRTEE